MPAIERAVATALSGGNVVPLIPILLPIGALFTFSLWIIINTMICVVKSDWVLASLVLVPLPILGSWLFYIQRAGDLFRVDLDAFNQWGASMALILSLLALAAGTIIRLRQRSFKILALVTMSMLAATMPVHIFWG